jgi:Tol biopolymer transport system component
VKATRTIVGLGLVVLSLVAAGSAASQERPLWLRFPAISPDGSTLVFAYGGDLYRVPVEGGLATPLTVYQGTDFMPVWSPDGEQIAFASDRTGNLDVWIMPAEGGRARRLTYHSADDRPWSFTQDGENVVYSSGRLDAAASVLFPSLAELYSVSTAGGRERQILTTPAEHVRFDRAGGRFLFQDQKGYENEWRKHHTSSIARDIWIHNLQDGSFTQLTRAAAEDRNPVFTPDESGMIFLSERGGTFNVYRASLDAPDQAEALTSFETHPVRSLTSSDAGLLAFSWDGEIYTLRPGAEPLRVPIEIRSDLPTRPQRTLTVTSGAREMALSPSGKEVAFVYRGEIFATSLETNVTKQVTRTPEQERSISFSPDGRSILYAGERSSPLSIRTGRKWRIWSIGKPSRS